jgi:hypothetical protein
MTHTIDTIPDRPSMGNDFGQQFNYDVWGPDTVATLCNVPWNSDYRDIISFADQAALDNYLDTHSIGGGFVINKMTYARAGNPVRLNLPFNIVYQYNYIRVYNPAQPVQARYTDGAGTVHTVNDIPKTFYYFVTNVRYLAPNTTELEVTLDVWQTFGRQVTFGNCYIQQGHIGIAQENQEHKYWKEYFTIPESHDLGSDYVIADAIEAPIIGSDIAQNSTGHLEYGPTAGGFGVFIVSTTSLIAPGTGYGTVDDPILTTATGSDSEAIPNGCEIIYVDSVAAFLDVMHYLSNYPWVAQGIISVTGVPSSMYDTSGLSNFKLNNGDTASPTVYGGSIPLGQMNITREDANSLINTSDFMSNFPSRYSLLTKFCTYPYTVVEVTTYTGSPLIFKPELFDDIADETDTHYGSLSFSAYMHGAPPNPQLTIVPTRYAFDGPDTKPTNMSYRQWDAMSEYLDMALIVSNFPQFSVVTNSYLEFMAQNAHRIPWSYNDARWTQQRALAGNQNDANVATMGIANIGAQNTIANSQRTAQTNLQNQMKAVSALANAVGSGVQGLESGGLPGAVGGLAAGAAAGTAGTMIENHFRNAATDIANSYSSASAYANQDYAGQARDANQAYANFAANGDYENAIAGIQARVQDMKLLQPSVVGQSGGEIAVTQLNGLVLTAKVKIPQLANVIAIGEYWLRYGYAINRFGRMPSNYMVMDKFTYWKLKETYITASTVPEMFKQAIRGIFEKGVTVWANPDDIGNLDIADNEPLTGITL